jgi:hypothetical protein|tara:strand:+ start:468 stop:737 length:270 start_codon:yes stop_codon:yes gene_type:complete
MSNPSGLHQLTLVLVDGTKQELDLRPIDFVAVERKFGTRPAAELQNLAFEELMFLCWNASKRLGTTDSFDKWLEGVAKIDGLEGDDSPG